MDYHTLDDEIKEIICDTIWLYSLDYVPRWYHGYMYGPIEDKVLISNALLVDVSLKPISPGNMPLAGANLESTLENNAMRVSNKSHSFIFEEKYFVVLLLNMIQIR